MMQDLTRRSFLVGGIAAVAGCSLQSGSQKEIRSSQAATKTENAPSAANNSSEMITISEGKFLMGTSQEQAKHLAEEYGYHVSWFSGELPQREVFLPAYAIDKYPVTNREYAAFCKAAHYQRPSFWNGDNPPTELLDHPVFEVNQADAAAYARWAGKRLPTEAEWEKAARGTDGRIFPWGNKFRPQACTWNRSQRKNRFTTPVNAHPDGASPYGVMDMAGNLAEWCQDNRGPYSASAVIKGGCWLTTKIFNLRSAARNMSGCKDNRSAFYGFRCVKEAGLL